MALDEGRLLILGAQVVFGCQFQMVFHEGFQDAPRESQAVQGIGLLALMLAVAILITPSMTHQIAYRGEDRRGALRVASTCAGLAGVPMTLGLGATTFVVFESLFNRNMGVVAGITFAAVAFSFLYALGLVLRIGHTGQMPPSEKQTLLKNKIEQLLTEARSSFLALRPCWGSSSSWFSCGLLASCRVGLKSPMPSPWRPLPCRSFC